MRRLSTFWLSIHAAFTISAILLSTIANEARARVDVDSKASVEFGVLPGAVGTSRKNEAWFGGTFGIKWKSESSDRFRLNALIAADFLILSPSVSSTSSQILGSREAKEWNRSGSPHFFEDLELFAEYRAGRTRTSLGSRTLRWGIADFFDPLDQINSRRMEKPAQASKRGEWMIFSEWRGAFSPAITIETFAIPIKRGAILPSVTSAWLPRQLYIPNLPDTEFNLPANLEYRYRDREERDAALRWNFGIRSVWRPGESELALQYDEGASSFPSIRPSVSGPLVGVTPEGRRVIQADPLIELTEIYYRERHYGASLVQPIGATLARLQFGKTEPLYEGRNLARDRADLSVGLERQIGMSRWGQVTILAQGFKNLLEEESGGNDIASFSRMFDRAAALGLRFSPQETTSLMVGGLRSLTKKGGTIILTSLSFDINPSVAAEVGWTWYEANLDSAIGPYKDNDGGSIKITASF